MSRIVGDMGPVLESKVLVPVFQKSSVVQKKLMLNKKCGLSHHDELINAI